MSNVKEYGATAISRNGFFDREAVEKLLERLSLVLELVPAGSSIETGAGGCEEITLRRTGGYISFYFTAHVPEVQP